MYFDKYLSKMVAIFFYCCQSQLFYSGHIIIIRFDINTNSYNILQALLDTIESILMAAYGFNAWK